MNETKRKHALRDLANEDIAALADSRITAGAVLEAIARDHFHHPNPERIAEELTEMLEAARDPREAAVDRACRKAK